MARRAFRIGALNVALDVSRGVQEAVEVSQDQQPDLLEFADPLPQLVIQERDPAAALDFLRPAPGGQRTATGASLAERVAALSWYHTIELPGGVVTNGQFDHRPLVRHYGLPANMHGLSALDVASFDGFWAFEMERRGARVTSIDLDRVASLDLPGPARLQLEEEGIDRDHDAGRAFAMAREALGSNVERRVESIYDLTPERHGTFDFVHVADVLLHLENPTRALRAVRAVTAGQALIVDAFRPGQDGAQWVEYRGGWQGLVWWMPSLSALGQMVLDAGFREVRLLNAYRLRKTAAGDPGLWRAVLQATP